MSVSLGPVAKTFRTEESYAAINALYQERGWSDGLPIVPPTAERSRKFFAYIDRARGRPWRRCRRATARRRRSGSPRTR